MKYEESLFAYKSGDIEAVKPLEELCRRYASRLVRRYETQISSEDIAQEAFLKIHQHVAQYDPTRSAAATWVHSIVRNLVYDAIKKERRTRVKKAIKEGEKPFPREIVTHILRGLDGALLDYNDERNFADIIAEREQVTIDVTTILDILDTHHAKSTETFRDHHMNGLSYEEIARRERIPIGTVKSRINAAKKIIQKELQKSNDGPPMS